MRNKHLKETGKRKNLHMKIKLVVVVVNMLLSTCLLANEGVTSFLIFQPQEMRVQEENIVVPAEQVAGLENFLTGGFPLEIGDNWSYRTASYALDLSFKIDTSYIHCDEYRLEID